MQKTLIIKTVWHIARANALAGKSRFIGLGILFGIFMNISPVAIIIAWSLIWALSRMENTYGTESLTLSLPVSRTHVVLSRYLTAAIITVFCFILGSAATGLERLGLALDPENMSITGNILMTLFPVVLLVAVYFPLYFRYGFQNGIYISTFMLMLPVSFINVLILDIAAQITAGGTINWTRFLIGDRMFLIQIAMSMKVSYISLGNTVYTLFVLILMAAMIYLSVILSIKFYKTRDF